MFVGTGAFLIAFKSLEPKWLVGFGAQLRALDPPLRLGVIVDRLIEFRFVHLVSSLWWVLRVSNNRHTNETRADERVNLGPD